MSKTKHTPGPWTANFNDYTKPYVEILNGDNLVIAQIPDGEIIRGDTTILGIENIEANIDLIAAAPDMYEALECACDQYCIGYTGNGLVKCEDCIIRKALRKARGETE